MKSLLVTVLILLLVLSIAACAGAKNETSAIPKSEDRIVLTRLENVILDSEMDEEIGVVLITEDGKTYDVIFKEHFDYNMRLEGGSITKNMSKLTVSIERCSQDSAHLRYSLTHLLSRFCP